MKKLILLTFLTTITAQANADCRISINTHGGPWSAMNDFSYEENSKSLETLKEILSEKGYEVTDNTDAPYKLSALAGSGYSCGNGLKWYDYLLIPIRSSISFSGNGKTIKKSSDRTGIAEGSENRAIQRTLKLVKNYIPNCEG